MILAVASACLQYDKMRTAYTFPLRVSTMMVMMMAMVVMGDEDEGGNATLEVDVAR